MSIVRTAEVSEYYFEERCFIKELLNSEAVPGLSIARARVAPGVTTVLHALAGTEIYYLLEGSGEVRVGKKIDRVGVGDLVSIAPEIPQQITNTGTTDLIFLAICTPRFVPEDYREVDESSTLAS